MLVSTVRNPRNSRRSTLAATAIISLGLAAVLLAGTAGPVAAAQPSGVRPPAAAAGTPVPVHPVRGHRVSVAAMAPWHRPTTVWPAAGSATVTLATPHSTSPAAGIVRAGSLPVRVGPPTAGAPGAVSRAAVSVAGQPAAAALGIRGVVLSVARADGVTSTGRVRVSLDYSGFAQAFGGDYAARLRLVRLAACALTTPRVAACRVQTPLSSANDVRGRLLSADVAVPAQSSTGSAVVLAAVAGPSGSAGNYAAEPISEADSWVHGDSSGDYTYSYPIDVPPVPGGLEPRVDLGYDSLAVSGLNSSTNNQPSWIGDGWAYSPGFIEQDLTTCATASLEPRTGDLCPDHAHWSLSLNGATTPLVNGGNGLWRGESDDGEQVTRTGNTWMITTPDGTKYYFGLNQLPGYTAGDPTTNSQWTVPVWEGCGQAGFCDVPWRYLLDYVVDPHGNAIAYFYHTETNSYAEQNGTTATGTYIRGGTLATIEYGLRAGSVYTTTPAAQVNFSSTPNRQDAPTDLTCTTGAACPITSPTFWSTDTLTGIATQSLVAGAAHPVDSWVMTTTYPDTGDATSSPSLWLSAITHTGQDGATALTLPPTTFAGIALPNRVQTTVDSSAGYSALTRRYLSSITNDTGGVTTIGYSPPDPTACTGASPPAPSTNTTPCYPDYWTPTGATAPLLDYFNQYVADTITEQDTTGGDPPVATHLSYAGAAWAYDLDQVSRSATVTWDQWRGYRTVTAQTGTAPAPTTQTTDTYLQGMSQQGPPGSPGPVVTLTTTRGQQATDSVQFAGMPLEQIEFTGAGSGQQVTDTIDLPWTSAATASDPILNQTAFLTGTLNQLTYTALAGGGARESTTSNTFTSDGLVASVSEVPDTGNAAESTCTTTAYAANTAIWLLDKPADVRATTGICSANNPTLVAETQYAYDGGTYGGLPTVGDATQTRQASANGLSPTFVTTQTATYDQYGRMRTDTDADNRTTTTAYTPATGAEPTSVQVTDPLGLVTTTNYDPARDLPLARTEPAGYQTTKTYDALGRETAAWTPGNPTTGPAVRTITYALSNTTASVITEQTEQPGGGYLTSQTLYDSLGQLRETQTATATGGTDIADTTYDSDGRPALTSNPYFVTGAPSGTLVAAAPASVPSQTGYVYDGAGRVVKQIAYALGTETWETDTTYGGGHTTVVPPTGGTSTTTFTDGRGLITAIDQYHTGVAADPTDPPSQYDQTAYTYTPAGKLAGITDAAGNTWSYTYDLLGEQTTQTDPDAGTSTTNYDPAGQVTATTDARGKTISTTYDADGRKTATYDTTGGAPQNSATQTAGWTYDTLGKGLPTSSTAYQGGAAYTEQITGYTTQGLPSGSATVIPTSQGALAGTYTRQYTYAPTGQLTAYTDQAAGGLPAETVTTGYNGAGQPVSLAGADTYVNALSYTNLDQPLQYQLGTPTRPIAITESYDQQTGRVTEQNTQTGTTTPTSVDDQHYTYDPTGNITSEANTPAGAPAATDVQCFHYDYLARLTQAWAQADTGCATTPTATAEGGAAPYWNTYTYNTVDNLTGITATSPTGQTTTTTDAYPATGSAQPHAIGTATVTSPSGTNTTGYHYDTAGHLTTVTGPTQAQALSWNDTGQLTQDTITPTGGTARNTNYVYDADGTLLLTNESGTTTLYLADEELSFNAGSVTGTRYYGLGATTVATRTGATTVAYLAGNSQGTDSVAIDATTLAVTRRYYDPYGNPRGTVPTTFPTGQKGFTGGTTDTTTGLTNLGAREYQPTTAAFISPDPLLNSYDPQHLNAYAYTGDNPTTYSDPTGATRCDVGYCPTPWQTTHGANFCETHNCTQAGSPYNGSPADDPDNNPYSGGPNPYNPSKYQQYQNYLHSHAQAAARAAARTRAKRLAEEREARKRADQEAAARKAAARKAARRAAAARNRALASTANSCADGRGLSLDTMCTLASIPDPVTIHGLIEAGKYILHEINPTKGDPNGIKIPWKDKLRYVWNRARGIGKDVGKDVEKGLDEVNNIIDKGLEGPPGEGPGDIPIGPEF